MYLGSESSLDQVVFMISAVLVLFGYFSSAGLHGYGEISTFLSMTSRWICPAIIVFCWPDRQWVQEKMAGIKQTFSSEQVRGPTYFASRNVRRAKSLTPQKQRSKAMNRLIVSFAALLMIYSSANAQAVKLRGEAANAFVAKYFPNAGAPALIKSTFTYTGKNGQHGRGLAKCIIPARSDGGQSLCKVIY